MFSRLGLSKDLLQVVKYAGYQTPTAVQAKTIPLILAGKDVVVQAPTGTGKTVSFVWPLLQLLQQGRPQERKQIKALILIPTRELAIQVNDVIKVACRHLNRPLRTCVLVGGMNIDVQLRNVRHGVDIVVATPGRLLDIIRRGNLDFNRLTSLVIDEADKMFDGGFADELQQVLKVLPGQRQNLLFSATLGPKVRSLTQTCMPMAMSIKEEGVVTEADNRHQRIIEVNRTNRGPLLRHLIQKEKWAQVLVFVASVRACGNLAEKLNKTGIITKTFHGSLTQAQRVQVLTAFKQKVIQVLVATDLAARGLDIEELPIVVNYDLPRSSDNYIHRIGRTARAGKTGMAVSFIGHEDQAHFSLIEKRGEMRLLRESIKGFELIGDPLPKIKGLVPLKGRRMSKKDKARALAMKKEG